MRYVLFCKARPAPRSLHGNLSTVLRFELLPDVSINDKFENSLLHNAEAMSDIACFEYELPLLYIAVVHLLLDVLQLALRQVVEDEVILETVHDQVGVV